MGKEDRKKMVLGVLEDSEAAMPSAAVFRNVKLRGATFERRSVNNYLRELVDEGKVLKVSPGALNEGDIVEVPPEEEGYFIAASAVSS